MNALIRRSDDHFSEVEGLRRALDQAYARVRERARTDWERRYPHGDPSDACVRVRIAHERSLR